ncbi:hypothetical protein ACFWOG_04540 [Kitasatospora sp. NPDC058406]|uniref:hypothetical protein n=1 Tax=Kitasatospora sp. NPDC058406 TaxID=3346483 RepID=UPI00364A38E9
MEPTRTPAGFPPAPTPVVPLRTVLAGLAVLRTRAGLPAQPVDTVEIAPDGRRVTVTASIAELSTWYDTTKPPGVAVGGRHEPRPDGQIYATGGLDWVLSLGQLPGCPGVTLSVVGTSAADEILPDTALVREMYPQAVRRQHQTREAADVLRMGWVA